jgi:hypothetical protein
MNLLTQSYGYQLFDTIVVRVSAINEKGTSLASAGSTEFATGKTVPQAVPSASITRGDETSENQLHVIWQPLTT